MDMATFRAMMESPEPDDAVPYLSDQDNNFGKSFPELRGDIDPSIPLADEAFGCLPEATNIWIGDERSVSSMHKGDTTALHYCTTLHYCTPTWVDGIYYYCFLMPCIVVIINVVLMFYD
jgi:hypothetical protein